MAYDDAAAGRLKLGPSVCWVGEDTGSVTQDWRVRIEIFRR
jgi:hypothetical protein